MGVGQGFRRKGKSCFSWGDKSGAIDRRETFRFLAKAWNAVQEGFRIRVLGGAKDIPNRSLFDEFSVEHDENAVGEVGDDSEIVCDEKN